VYSSGVLAASLARSHLDTRRRGQKVAWAALRAALACLAHYVCSGVKP